MKNTKCKGCIIGIIGVILLLGLDQFTKYLAVCYLKDGNSVILIKDIFQLHYLENRGAAFGMFQGGKIGFVIITLLVVALLSVVYWRSLSEKRFIWIQTVLVFLMAGAFGNFIDRIRLNYVVDFFYFELIDFPIFNVADIYITCGVVALFLLFIFYYKEEDLEVLLPSGKKKDGKKEK